MVLRRNRRLVLEPRPQSYQQNVFHILKSVKISVDSQKSSLRGELSYDEKKLFNARYFSIFHGDSSLLLDSPEAKP